MFDMSLIQFVAFAVGGFWRIAAQFAAHPEHVCDALFVLLYLAVACRYRRHRHRDLAALALCIALVKAAAMALHAA